MHDEVAATALPAHQQTALKRVCFMGRLTYIVEVHLL
jgi:hypothetical protein